MRDPGPDPYRVLGVSRDATAADITRAYRQRARAVHPDTAPAGTEATARFRAVADAYQVLSDPGRRAGYDRARHGQAAPGRAFPGPTAGTPLGWPRAAANPEPVRMAPLWAGPVHVKSLHAAEPRSGPGADSQAAAAAFAGLVRWYLSALRDGLW
jgi:curved DNA-binding protein CbpA